MHVIVIAFEQFPASAFGFMGNQRVSTKNFDTLASRGIVFDKHYAKTISQTNPGANWFGQPASENAGRANSVANSVLENGSLGKLLTEQGYQAKFVCESGVRTKQPGCQHVENCQQVENSDLKSTESVTESVEEAVGSFRSWVQAMKESVAKSFQSPKTQTAAQPTLLWGIARGVPHYWEQLKFPEGFGITVEKAIDDREELDQLDIPCDPEFEPDEVAAHSVEPILSVAERLVSTFDLLIGELLEQIWSLQTEMQKQGEQVLLVLTSAQGAIAQSDVSPLPDDDSILNSDENSDEVVSLKPLDIQTLFVLSSPVFETFGRSLKLMTSDQVAELLTLPAASDGTTLDNTVGNLEKNFPILEVLGNFCFSGTSHGLIGGADIIVSQNDRGDLYIQNEKFALVASAKAQQQFEKLVKRLNNSDPEYYDLEELAQSVALYLKPEDRHDENDVSPQYPEIVFELFHTYYEGLKAK